MKKNKNKDNNLKIVRSVNKNVRSSTRKLNPILKSIVGKKVDIALTESLHEWFAEQLAKTDTSNDKIIRAELELETDNVTCTLEIEDEVYHHTKPILND